MSRDLSIEARDGWLSHNAKERAWDRFGDKRGSKQEQADYLPPVANGAGIVVLVLTFLLAISPFLAGFAYWIKS